MHKISGGEMKFRFGKMRLIFRVMFNMLNHTIIYSKVYHSDPGKIA